MSEAAAEWTIGRLIEWTRGFFDKKGIPSPRLEAEILLAHVLGCERIALYMQYDQHVEDAQRNAFRDLVKRRSEREPTRYLVGGSEFLSLAMKITPACLIPRPETEQLVEEVLRDAGLKKKPAPALGPAAEDYRRVELPEPAPTPADPVADPKPAPPAVEIIELCTGCGCVAVSLAANLPAARITATDLSTEALDVARQNAEAHGVADRMTFLAGDLYEPLDAADVPPADFLLANPPYVSEADWAKLEPEVRDHEPRTALVSGPLGTEIIERILKGAPAYLKPGGRLLIEIGSDEGPAVQAMAEAVRGLANVEVLKDYAGLDRILSAVKAK
jgi:release factor glutamine methyltransferase